MAEWQFRDKTVTELPFGCLIDFPDLPIAIQTQIQMQHEAYRMHTYNEVPYRWGGGGGWGRGRGRALGCLSGDVQCIISNGPWDPCELNGREIQLKT